MGYQVGWWCSVMLAAAACGGDGVRAPRGDGVLVLEVGGDQPSLRAALQSAGRTVEPPHWLSPRAGSATVSAQPLPAPRPEGDEPGPGHQPVSPAPEVVEPPAPEPQPEPEWITVPLPKGETLIHVARRHLGDGRRYLELLQWNGWSDADARRLGPDTPVRIKRSELRGR